MPDPLDERPWPDLLDQQAEVEEPGVADDWQERAEQDQELVPAGDTEADPGDLLDQRRVVQLPEEETE